MSRLRILVGADVLPDPNAGASGTVFQMNAALRRLGHEVDEIWQPEMGRRISHGNLHYLLELPWSYRRAVRNRTRKKEYHVIELNQPHAYLAAADYRRSGRPGVFVNRSHGHEVRSEEALRSWRQKLGIGGPAGLRGAASTVIRRLLDRQWELIAKSADGFVVSCTEDAEFLLKQYGIDRGQVGVVTQGVLDANLNRPPVEFSSDRLKRLLYVGQLAFFKAPMVLAKAIHSILSVCPDVQMTWVCGRAHHDEAQRLLGEAILPRVTFLDWMPQEHLLDVYDRHGVFLFPSFFEGFGKTPLEAMSRGLCVVASRTGGMRDYIQDGVSGKLVPVGDSAAMADATLRLLGDVPGACKMSDAARATAKSHTWDRCAQDVVGFYYRLLQRKQSKVALDDGEPSTGKDLVLAGPPQG